MGAFMTDILNKTKDFDIVPSAQELGLSYIVECYVCGIGEIAVRGVWPDGWKVVKKYGYNLCPECAEKLRGISR